MVDAINLYENIFYINVDGQITLGTNVWCYPHRHGFLCWQIFQKKPIRSLICLRCMCLFGVLAILLLSCYPCLTLVQQYSRLATRFCCQSLICRGSVHVLLRAEGSSSGLSYCTSLTVPYALSCWSAK